MQLLSPPCFKVNYVGDNYHAVYVVLPDKLSDGKNGYTPLETISKQAVSSDIIMPVLQFRTEQIQLNTTSSLKNQDM